VHDCRRMNVRVLFNLCIHRKRLRIISDGCSVSTAHSVVRLADTTAYGSGLSRMAAPRYSQAPEILALSPPAPLRTAAKRRCESQ